VLVGLASKNAILVVEFAKQQHLQGKSRREATLEASRLRLRPILMTSFAFIFGVIPWYCPGSRCGKCAGLWSGRVQRHVGRNALRNFPNPGIFLRDPMVWRSKERGCRII